MILCEFGPDGGPCLFSGPDELIVVARPDEVAPALARLEARRRAGGWIAGWISYELGYALEPALAGLMPQDRAMPLMVMGVYDAPGPAPALPAGDAARLRYIDVVDRGIGAHA